MLQAHSFVWHYLWVAPSVLLLALAGLSWRERIYRRFPFFFIFIVADCLQRLALYFADIVPSVSAQTWWRMLWACLVVEGVLKFALIAEIFSNAFSQYASLAKLGQALIRGIGIFLVMASAVAAAYAPKDSVFGIVSGAHLLDQTTYLIESGLLVSIFLFSAYFRLRPERLILGIALGLGISACVHLATWAVLANGGLPDSKRILLDFVNMATYHVCILIWFYYLLVPRKVVARSAVPLPENNLDVWNRELERLIHL
jgi:hypothetical protein